MNMKNFLPVLFAGFALIFFAGFLVMGHISKNQEDEITLINNSLNHLRDSIRNENEVHTYMDITSYEVEEPMEFRDMNGNKKITSVKRIVNNVRIVKGKGLNSIKLKTVYGIQDYNQYKGDTLILLK